MIEIKHAEEKSAAFVPMNRIREEISDVSAPSHIVQEVRANLELLDDLHGRLSFMMNEVYRIVKR